ncbi:MAG: radical SAM protein [Myxococcales bacterium]|nr:radical SAM protein [Myxococcales bacterium]
MSFVAAWRKEVSRAFDLPGNSTAGRTIPVDFWGTPREVYANANLSIYSAQRCNARCAFCVEELRPASRGQDLRHTRATDVPDDTYFAALHATLVATAVLRPSVSITGGEPSLDPRLPEILRRTAGARKHTLTTNASGLLQHREGRTVLDHVLDAGVHHLNISRAHPDHDRNHRLMGYREGLTDDELMQVVRRCAAAGTRVRLSCVLLRSAIHDLQGVRSYLRFAQSVGVDAVIFRRLMGTDPTTHARNHVVRYCDRQRTELTPLLEGLSHAPDFHLQRQVVGYYYYVEVWRWQGVDVCFEEADLAQLERTKSRDDVVHELVFHPSGTLASTWQPYDGVLGPPPRG